MFVMKYDFCRTLNFKLTMSIKIQPTEAELEILQILWADQPMTVKEVHEQISQSKDVGYTTVLKQMQRMEGEKKMLSRYKEGKVHYYSAILNKSAVLSSSLNKFIDSFFNGSTSQLVMHDLGNKPTSKEELE